MIHPKVLSSVEKNAQGFAGTGKLPGRFLEFNGLRLSSLDDSIQFIEGHNSLLQYNPYLTGLFAFGKLIQIFLEALFHFSRRGR